MRRATFLAAAQRDLVEIHAYVAEASGSVNVGESFTKKLRAKCHKLAAIEGTVGRARLALRADLRSFPFEGYVILFRYAGRRFEVVNIIEHHRDIDSYFARDDGHEIVSPLSFPPPTPLRHQPAQQRP